MAIIPKKIDERIAFAENHLAVFLAHATAIGTTTAAVTALQTKTEAARAAFSAKGIADDAAKGATNDLSMKLTAMTDALSTIIKQVKTQAAITGNSVYTLASLPTPATPGPVPPPGTPYAFGVELLPNGSLKFTWSCDNPIGSVGTLYMLWRLNETTGKFESLGGAGGHEFTDTTVPSAVAAVTYKIQAVRTTAVGVEAQFTVNFGTTGATITPSVAAGPSAPKIAA